MRDFCEHQWRGENVGVANRPWVPHECELRPGHDGDHRCLCGARVAQMVPAQ